MTLIGRITLSMLCWVAFLSSLLAEDPLVTFSKDEKTVRIHYGRTEWTLARPVTCAWDYEQFRKVYWVSVTGNDENAGTQDKPFRTIGKALDRATAGDITYVRAGTYVEALLITKSGEEKRPIIISCASGDLGKVYITPPKEYVGKNPSGAVITLKGAQYVWINGFVIQGPRGRPEAPTSEHYGANGITWQTGAGTGDRATNNVIFDNVHCGLKKIDHEDTDILVEGNVIFNNGTGSLDHGIYMPADSVTMNGNVIFNNTGYGIHAYEFPKELTITRNICFANKTGGIVLSGSNSKVLNNVCAHNEIGMFYFRKECKNNVVKNNIFAFNKIDCGYDNGGGKLGDPSENLDDFNCYFPGKPTAAIRPGPNELLADPHFVNPKKGDYRLKPNSLCRGRGVDVGLPFDGKKPNLGAY